MNARRAVERLLELSSDADDGSDTFNQYIDDTAIELLTVLCSNLSFALAAVSGKSVRKNEARERVVEYVAGISTVLDVWQSTAIEVVDGPGLSDSPIDTVILD